MKEELAMAVLVGAAGYARRELALREAGDAKTVVAEPERYARALGEEGVLRVKQGARRAEEMQERFEREGIRLVVRDGEDYPPLLAHIARPPHLLFVRGETKLGDACPLAVVGTRSANDYGLRHTRRIARELAEAGACVVSGLALGVDSAAHRGALDAHGRTVAVLGGAHDCFYPAGNRPLLRAILEGGGSVVTEYPMGMSPTRYSFVQRNRIIAGMSLGVLVTQGAMRSGALSTAQSALEEGREVFALPGSVDDPLSRLPNRLLAEGAQMAVCGGDILGALVADAREEQPRPAAAPKRVRVMQEPEKGPAPLPSGLGEQERAILTALSRGEMEFDALCEATRIPAQEMGALLSLLELDGLIAALPGLRYMRA